VRDVEAGDDRELQALAAPLLPSPPQCAGPQPGAWGRQRTGASARCVAGGAPGIPGAPLPGGTRCSAASLERVTELP
jgi:hypothetical protein